jgi:hypothetical protein
MVHQDLPTKPKNGHATMLSIENDAIIEASGKHTLAALALIGASTRASSRSRAGAE